MRHRGGAKCACRVDPSTSGGAAESSSSMYACNPPEGPSMCQRRPIADHELRAHRHVWSGRPIEGGDRCHGARVKTHACLSDAK